MKEKSSGFRFSTCMQWVPERQGCTVQCCSACCIQPYLHSCSLQLRTLSHLLVRTIKWVFWSTVFSKFQHNYEFIKYGNEIHCMGGLQKSNKRTELLESGRCKYFIFKITQRKMSQRTFSSSKIKGIMAFLCLVQIAPTPFAAHLNGRGFKYNFNMSVLKRAQFLSFDSKWDAEQKDLFISAKYYFYSKKESHSRIQKRYKQRYLAPRKGTEYATVYTQFLNWHSPHKQKSLSPH